MLIHVDNGPGHASLNPEFETINFRVTAGGIMIRFHKLSILEERVYMERKSLNGNDYL